MRRLSIYNNYSKNNQNKRYKLSKTLKDNGFIMVPNGELLVVLGGDGTFLSAIKEKYKEDVVFTCLNSGTLGFFSEYNYEELPDFVKMLKEQKYEIEEYPIYEVEITQKNGISKKEIFINDLVIEKKSPKIIHMNVKFNEKEEIVYGVDGLIFSTSLGSSAYSMAGNGAVFLEPLNILQVTPVMQVRNQAYRGPLNSLLVNDEAQIEIAPDKKKKRRFRVVCDGKEIKLRTMDTVKVRKLDYTLKILRSTKYNRISHLKNKIF